MRARKRLKVAAAQYPIDRLATFAEWREKSARWIAEGAATGASLLVFPEYGAIELAATRGDAVSSDLAKTLAAVADLSNEMIATYADLACRHGVYILAPSGPANGTEQRFVNAAHLVTPTGQVGVQEKLIMTPFEHDWGVSAGRQLKVFETALGRIGIAICYDSEFPLLVRAQAEAGADLVLVPSCTERLSGYHRVRTAAAARALENGIATIMSPTVGEALWSAAVDYNIGAAGVFVPAEAALSMTGVLTEGTVNERGWIAAEIDLEALHSLRARGEMRNSKDWYLQPGAADLRHLAEVVRLD
jgi:predicted amidohydrolase